MRNLRLGITLIATLAMWACSSASAEPSNSLNDNPHIICGVVDSISPRMAGIGDQTGNQLTNVFFSDNRELVLVGTPEITVTKEAMYAFSVGPMYGSGRYPLVKTYPAQTCNGDEKYGEQEPSESS